MPLAVFGAIRVRADSDRLGVDATREQLAAQLVQPRLRVDAIADLFGRPRALGDGGGTGPAPAPALVLEYPPEHERIP